MKELKDVCKSLTDGLFGTFANTITFLLKKSKKVKILSVYHHIEYSNFWDDLQIELNNVVIDFRVKYPTRFQTVIVINYLKMPNGLIVKVDKQYEFSIFSFYDFFIKLAHGKENEVYAVPKIDNAYFFPEYERCEYQFELLSR